MKKLVCVAALLLGSGSASAASLTWESGPGAGTCGDESSLIAEIEARLGKPLSEVAGGAQQIRVRAEQDGESWVGLIELRDQAGTLEGTRKLVLSGEHCTGLQRYAALAVALMIDPHAELTEPGEPTESEGDVPPEPSEVPAHETAPPRAHPSTPPAELGPSISGEGDSVLYLYPPLMSKSGQSDASQFSPSALVRSLEHHMAEKLLERETFTVVRTAEPFEREAAMQSWARRVRSVGSLPRPLVPRAGKLQRAPAAGYVMVPVLKRIELQDALDYSLGDSANAVAVTVTLSAVVLDLERQRELRDVEVTTTVSVGGRADVEAFRRQATQMALEHVAGELLGKLRRYAPFRLRPRFVRDATGNPRIELGSLRGVSDGDVFVFEDASGDHSGYATVSNVGPTSADLVVHKGGSGERLVEEASYRPWVLSIYGYAGKRSSYSGVSAADRQVASERGLRAQALGSGSDYGIGARAIHAPAGGGAYRALVDARAALMLPDGAALGNELMGGFGYELWSLPSLGLAVTPYAKLGGLLIRGKLGDKEGSGGYLDALLGATLTVGAQIEAYRLLGSISVMLGGELQYVQPVWSQVPSDQYLHGELPPLHGLLLHLGGIVRGSDYED